MDLVLLGCLFLVGFAADVAGRLTPLPRVSFLLLSGIVIGPSVLGVVPARLVSEWFPLLTNIALSMVGFLIGQELTYNSLRQQGRAVLSLSLAKALVSAAVVFASCIVAGLPLAMCAALAGIASATAPAATFDIVHEAEAQSANTKLLLGVVALDDLWGLIIFAMLIAFATNGDADLAALGTGLTEIGGSLAIGAILGVPMAYITGRIRFSSREGEPILAESLGFIFVAAGAAIYLQLSPILTAIGMGAVVAQLARHHNKPFNAIEGIEWPFMILFFTMAGASLELNYLTGSIGLVALYLLARSAGIVSGTLLGGRLVQQPPRTSLWLSMALFPQGGVELGMALIAAQRFPELAQLILTVVLAAIVILDLVAPPVSRYSVRQLERAA